MADTKRKYDSVLMYVRPKQKQALDRLAKSTRIPRTVLVREAVDDLLRKYKRKGGNK